MDKNTQQLEKFVVIKTKKAIFISNNPYSSIYDSRTSVWTRTLFDGELAQPTYLTNWQKLKSIPKKVESVIPEKKEIIKYKLKEGFAKNKKTPVTLPAGSFAYNYELEECDNEEIKGLYKPVYKITPEHNELIKFEIVVLDEVDNFEPIAPKFKIKHSLLNEIQTPNILLTDKPCKLSINDTYTIVRKHIKNYINPQYARITSDYDFCFTVKKIIELHKPFEYEVDVNAYKKRARPKYKKRHQNDRETAVFEMTNERNYQHYTTITPFEGKNNKDLEKNIEVYLAKLMNYINEPIMECEHCKGRGVVMNDSRLKAGEIIKAKKEE